MNGSLGPMARTVQDLAIVLDVIVGYDPEDPLTALGVGRAPKTYTAFLDREDGEVAHVELAEHGREDHSRGGDGPPRPGRRKTGPVHEVKAGSGGAIRHTATPDRVHGLPGTTEGWSGAEASEVTPTDLRGGGSHGAETSDYAPDGGATYRELVAIMLTRKPLVTSCVAPVKEGRA